MSSTPKNLDSLSGGTKIKSKSMVNNKYIIQSKEISIMNELGKGAFGSVYKGYWRSTEVAVKMLKNVVLSEDQINEFFHECSVMMNMKNHLNVVKFLGLCDNPLCLLTEFLEKGSLDKFLMDPTNDIDYKLQMKIIKDIAAGMQHLQFEKIVHKDLAARNILLDKELNAKVSDFGLSRVHEGNSEEAVIYSKSETGPLKWMAPESLNSKVYSVKSDVWSFGITCLEIFTRTRPYPDCDILEFSKRIVSGQLNPQDYLRREVMSQSVYELILSCWKIEPSDRPDFKQIVELLKQVHNLVELY